VDSVPSNEEPREAVQASAPSATQMSRPTSLSEAEGKKFLKFVEQILVIGSFLFASLTIGPKPMSLFLPLVGGIIDIFVISILLTYAWVSLNEKPLEGRAYRFYRLLSGLVSASFSALLVIVVTDFHQGIGLNPYGVAVAAALIITYPTLAVLLTLLFWGILPKRKRIERMEVVI